MTLHRLLTSKDPRTERRRASCVYEENFAPAFAPKKGDEVTVNGIKCRITKVKHRGLTTDYTLKEIA